MVILGVSRDVAIVISTSVAVLYTMLGGLYSVVCTDVIQLFFVFFGLVRTAFYVSVSFC